MKIDEKSAEVIVSHNNERRTEFRKGERIQKNVKGKMKQKRKIVGKQTKLFDNYDRPLLVEENCDTGIDNSRVDFLSALEVQRLSTERLMDKILDHENVKTAIKEVKTNKGVHGVDGKNIDETIDWMRRHYNQLRKELLEEKYKVQAVKKVEILKPEGGVRILGIPTVLDRIIQQSIHQILSPLYDKHFSENSYGFRKNRNAHMAIMKAAEYVSEGYEWVVDIDLEKYFDTIPHDRLMQRLSKGIGDKNLLRLIRQYLEAGMIQDGLIEQRVKGSPQGGPLSPLLSNIVLDELDKELEKRGHKFCRYADDCNVFVASKAAGERVMESIVRFIEGKLKLKVNREKSGVKKCSSVKFLGYTILGGGNIRISDKSIKTFKKKIIEVTKRNRGVKIETIITELNRMIRGYAEYYKLANSWLNNLRDIDGWIRRRIRCYRLKQCKRTYAIVKFLRILNIAENQCWNGAYWHRHGWWGLTLYPPISKAMGIQYFKELGLYSLQSIIERK
jgi:RNA-directed DNA polymerase